MTLFSQDSSHMFLDGEGTFLQNILLCRFQSSVMLCWVSGWRVSVVLKDLMAILSLATLELLTNNIA